MYVYRFNMSNRVPCTSYQCRRRTPATWKIAKINTMLTTWNKRPNTSAHCILVSELPRKTQHSQTLDDQYFLHKQKRHGKTSFSSGHQSPVARVFPGG